MKPVHHRCIDTDFDGTSESSSLKALSRLEGDTRILECTQEPTLESRIMRQTSNQTSKVLSLKLQNAKRQKVANLPQAQVIAANFTKRRSRKASSTTRNSRWQSGQSFSPTCLLHTSSDLTETVRAKPLQVYSKLSKKGSQINSEKYIKGEQVLSLKAIKESRFLRSRTAPHICTKLQPKQIEPEREVKKRRHKRKRKADESHQNDTSRIKRRVKYLLNRMNLEQNLIDAYSAEGWKGQSREKLRPERELQKAKAQILRFQLGIRDAIQELDSLGSEGTMKEYIFDSNGQIYHEDIFCAICKRQDAVVNNDIILCDGACDRAFHQLCLRPPLRTDDIPPDDEGWLCPVCDCKSECLEAVNAHLGTSYDMGDHWKKIFAEAAIASENGNPPAAVEEWPSEDSEDDDYVPGQEDNSIDIDARDREASNDESASVTSSEQGSSDYYSNDDVDSKLSLLNELAGIMENGFDTRDGRDHLEELASMEEDNVVLVDGKRQRKEVDYKRLHDEMFGKNTAADEASEDEEWGPGKRLRKSKQSVQIFQREPKENHLKNNSTGDTGNALLTRSSPTLQNRQSRVCLSPHAVEKLRSAFKENPLPSRACKEGLSKQLGLSFGKVHIWFKNVRCAALKKGLIQRAKGRGRNPLGPTSSTKGTHNSEVNKKATSLKAGKRAERECWLAVLDMLSEAQLKLERLRLLLQQTRTETHDSGTLMYVAVAELKERLS
eukprot:c21111_g1_i1 orf=190-2352(+)